MLGVLLENWVTGSLGGGDLVGGKVHYYVHTLSISRYYTYARTRIDE